MKNPNKRELQQTAFNCSLDIGFQDFMNLYKKCSAKPYSFDYIIPYWLYSCIGIFFTFQKESCGKNIKVNHDSCRRLKTSINRKATKISALPSAKFDKHEYITG